MQGDGTICDFQFPNDDVPHLSLCPHHACGNYPPPPRKLSSSSQMIIILIPDNYSHHHHPPRDDPKIAAGWSPRLDSAARPYPSLRYVCLQVVELLFFFVKIIFLCQALFS